MQNKNYNFKFFDITYEMNFVFGKQCFRTFRKKKLILHLNPCPSHCIGNIINLL